MKQVSRFSASSLKSLVGVDGELKSLNDLWKFAGSPKNRDPYFWCRQVETQRFIESECKLLKTDRKSVLKTKRGKFGGTYASNRI